MIRALVTRPQPGAAQTAAALTARGVAVLVEPMLTIELLPPDILDLGDVQALLFTSANGARAFAVASPERRLPVLAVGNATARAARAAGFEQVRSAAGDAGALAGLAARCCDPSAGALLHACSADVAADLAGSLAGSGFAVRREVLYRARAAEALSPELIGALRGGQLQIALFFSPRTAAVFARLAERNGVGSACRLVRACVLSEAVAGALAGLAWRGIRVARRPDREAMMAEVDTIVKRLNPSGAERCRGPEGR